MIVVEVAYALAERQKIVTLEVEEGCTALEAVKRSKIAEAFSEIDLESAKMGVFSKHLDGKMLPLPNEYQLKAQDRVEIYRPLLLDPKAARALRAKKAKEKKDKDKEKG